MPRYALVKSLPLHVSTLCYGLSAGFWQLACTCQAAAVLRAGWWGKSGKDFGSSSAPAV